MPFFTDETVQRIADQHIERIGRLEESEARRLISRYTEIRQQLRDRLDLLPQDKFTAQHLRGVILQVETAILAMKESLVKEMTDAGDRITQEGINDLLSEIKFYEKEFTGAVIPINVNAAVIANTNREYLFNRYDASLDAYSAAIRADMVRAISTASIEQITTDELVRRISRFLIGEEWKLRRVARTELHHVYNAAKQTTMEEVKSKFIPDLKKTLFHHMDDRTAEDSKQLNAENPIVSIDKPFVFIYRRKLASGEIKKEKRIFMSPPDRPNDRSILLPYRDEWSG